MEIIPDEEEVEIDAIPLTVKSPMIIDWMIYKEGRKSYYQIMRAGGKSQMYIIFSQMLKSFDKEDLYKLVKAKYESTRPVEDLDLILWGDLKTMFKPHVEDKVWRNQQDYKVLNWKLYDSRGVHSLMMQHVQIYMLVEKKYPLAPLILSMIRISSLREDFNLLKWDQQSRNKAILVAQGYNQQECIDYDETYAPIARLESIRILLAIACANDFKLYQIDIKIAFLNGFINEDVYVAQPPGFIDFQKPNYVYKLKKALYGLKQALKAWYDRLKTFLIKHEYSMGIVDNTLFTKKSKSHLIIVQIYVGDIIFGSTSQNLCDNFAKIMHEEFQMSMMGELNFFLGLQIKQMEDGIFFNQSKYIKEMLKKFGLEDSKPTKTPMSTEIKVTKEDEADSLDSSKYRGVIGSLLYLTVSKPDIMFSVCLCARF
ncbi:retrovirus-related pol polyprotein from transposon TNT 1-94 [Tanacetum coccineum]